MTFPFPYPTPMEPTLSNIIRSQGLTGNLRLLMDAHDKRSYPGSGQTWFDISGNGYDFFLGTNSSATAEDPTFAGTPGRPDAYFAFDGGDYFRYDSANEPWMDAIHKDNAKYTFIAWLYPVSGVNNLVMGTAGSFSGHTGFQFGVVSSNKVTMRIPNAGATVLLQDSAATITGGAWNFVAASVDEATGFGAFQCNATQETFTSTYSSPSSGSASFAAEVASLGNATAPMPNGSRLASLAAWEGTALTQAQIDAIFQTTRGRFGI